MENDKTTLNLAGWQAHSRANGPGQRFVIWTQGCSLACPGCFSPETHSFRPNQVITVSELADRILAVDAIEGVTYSGGEPMHQSHGLALLSERLQAADLTVMCYTGHTLESLSARNDPWVNRLLAAIDVLIDGPYVREQAGPFMWRGSANQRVLFLSDAYRNLESDACKEIYQVEFVVGATGLSATGIWPAGFWDRVAEALRG